MGRAMSHRRLEEGQFDNTTAAAGRQENRRAGRTAGEVALGGVNGGITLERTAGRRRNQRRPRPRFGFSFGWGPTYQICITRRRLSGL